MKLRNLFVLVLAAFALVVAGCADDDNSTATGSNGADESDATAVDGDESDDAADAGATGDAEPVVWDSMGSTVNLENTSDLNIAQIAAGVPLTQELTRLVLQAGLLPTVRDGGPFTVFAPLDEAFAAVDTDALRRIQQDKAQLASVLTLHVVSGIYTAEDLVALDGTSLTTVQGGQLLVEVDGDNVVVGGATVAVPDITASNGVIHAIDTVITAPNG